MLECSVSERRAEHIIKVFESDTFKDGVYSGFEVSNPDY